MPRLPKMIPVSDLRDDVADVLRRVQKSREPLVVTQRGRAAAVLLSVREYERAEYERQILRALARGEQEIGEGAGHDLDSVLAEADALLNADEP
jgi:prevent-host-death family protein